MKIITKRQADRLLVEGLFKPGGTPRVGNYDMGKYKAPPKELIGREVADIEGVLAVFPVRQRDGWGPYTSLKSLTLN